MEDAGKRGREICSRGPRDPDSSVGRSFATRRAFSMHHGGKYSHREIMCSYTKSLYQGDAIYHSLNARHRAVPLEAGSDEPEARGIYSCARITRVRGYNFFLHVCHNLVIVETARCTNLNPGIRVIPYGIRYKRRYNLSFDKHMYIGGVGHFPASMKLRFVSFSARYIIAPYFAIISAQLLLYSRVTIFFISKGAVNNGNRTGKIHPIRSCANNENS